MTVATTYEHVAINAAGVPIVKGTTVKIIEIVLDVKAYGWSPEEIHLNHPHLSLGQIYSALAYYYDHAAELDEDIQRRYEDVQRIRKEIESPEISMKLEAKGLLKCR